MAERPAKLWKEMPLDKRVTAAEAFWRDRESPDIDVQQTEAVLTLARKLNFRTRSFQALPVERRARHLAQLGDVSDAVATRALIAYHFAAKRALMSAFLDALGIKHDNGLIAEENPTVPDRARVEAAVDAVRAAFDRNDVDLYLKTLAALDGDTWVHLDAVLSGAS